MTRRGDAGPCYQALKLRGVGRLPPAGWPQDEEQLRVAIREIQERDRGRSP